MTYQAQPKTKTSSPNLPLSHSFRPLAQDLSIYGNNTPLLSRTSSYTMPSLSCDKVKSIPHLLFCLLFQTLVNLLYLGVFTFLRLLFKLLLKGLFLSPMLILWSYGIKTIPESLNCLTP